MLCDSDIDSKVIMLYTDSLKRCSLRKLRLLLYVCAKIDYCKS
jgi:hypothetical protein